jgi:anti-anti-sigma factor
MRNFVVLSQSQAAGILIIKPAGMLDVFNFGAFRRFVRDLCDSSHRISLLVDLGSVDYIASSGWSVLLNGRRILVLRGGDLSICRMQENLKRAYETMKIGAMLPASESLEEGVRFLQAHETGAWPKLVSLPALWEVSPAMALDPQERY